MTADKLKWALNINLHWNYIDRDVITTAAYREKLHMQMQKLKTHTHIQDSHTVWPIHFFLNDFSIFPIIYDCLSNLFNSDSIMNESFRQICESIHWNELIQNTHKILLKYDFYDCINYHTFYRPKNTHLKFPDIARYSKTVGTQLSFISYCGPDAMCVCKPMLFLHTRPYWVQVINMLDGKLLFLPFRLYLHPLSFLFSSFSFQDGIKT